MRHLWSILLLHQWSAPFIQIQRRCQLLRRPRSFPEASSNNSLYVCSGARGRRRRRAGALSFGMASMDGAIIADGPKKSLKLCAKDSSNSRLKRWRQSFTALPKQCARNSDGKDTTSVIFAATCSPLTVLHVPFTSNDRKFSPGLNWDGCRQLSAD